jgi:hypothetical protein
MGKPKRKLSPAEKAEKKRRRREFMTIFINGKQKRVRRPPFIVRCGIPAPVTAPCHLPTDHGAPALRAAPRLLFPERNSRKFGVIRYVTYVPGAVESQK